MAVKMEREFIPIKFGLWLCDERLAVWHKIMHFIELRASQPSCSIATENNNSETV